MCGVCRDVSCPFLNPRPAQVLDGGKVSSYCPLCRSKCLLQSGPILFISSGSAQNARKGCSNKPVLIQTWFVVNGKDTVQLVQVLFPHSVSLLSVPVILFTKICSTVHFCKFHFSLHPVVCQSLPCCSLVTSAFCKYLA